MRRAAIVTPLRTPVGTFGGSLKPVPVEELAATAVRAVVAKSGIDPARIEDVVFAQSYASSEVPCARPSLTPRTTCRCYSSLVRPHWRSS